MIEYLSEISEKMERGARQKKMIFLTRDVFRNNIYNIYNNFKTHW